MLANPVTIIDTSSWIEALRKTGRPDIRERVKTLLINGEAAWCDMIRLELWNGARGDYERKHLAKLDKEILNLPTTDDVWNLARTMARESRGQGQTIPAADLIIAACAVVHHANLEHCDAHFDVIFSINGN